MISDKTVEESLDWLRENAPIIGRAKALAYMLEEGEKIKIAELKGQSNEKTDASRKDYAYSHPEYYEHIKKTAKKIEEYENLKVLRDYHAAMIEAWRSMSANQRNLGNFR